MPNPTTPILDLDEMVQAQANAYLIFNEAIRALERVSASGFTRIIHDATAEHTIAGDEWGAYLRMTSASANDVVVPDDATLGIAASDPFVIKVFQAGAGETSFLAESGVSINAGALTIPAQYDAATLIHVGADEWDLIAG